MIDLFYHFRPLLITMALCTPRLLTAFLIAPFFNSEMIGGVTRNCIVLALSLVIFPAVLPFVESHELSMGFIAVLVVKEAIIGAVMGFLVGLFFYAVGMVGQLIDYQRGAMFAMTMDPSTGEQISVMGSLFTQVTILLFFTGGGFLLFLSGMYESYRIWPVETYWPSLDAEFATFFLGKVDEMMALALLLASPVMIVLFVSEFGLGLINRFAPQLNVFFLSMPIKSGVGLLILIFYLEILIKFLGDNLIQRFDIFIILQQVMH